MRANGLSAVSEDSSLKNDMPPTRRYGMMKRPSARMPTPPSQWSSERHIRTPGGAWSSPTITVEPVVLIAETDSKKACAKVSFSDESHSGLAPVTQAESHGMLTARKPIRLLHGGGPARVAAAAASESPPVTKAERKKISESGCP